jgi:hypothetical protein
MTATLGVNPTEGPVAVEHEMLVADNGLDERSAPSEGAIRMAAADIVETEDIAASLRVQKVDSREFTIILVGTADLRKIDSKPEQKTIR